jgi:alkanesulfonate monooxygenase SsuD/methylene tetrahydromethanopterin reductase-like flavin-dependent oxidoreductase (luciferase family)
MSDVAVKVGLFLSNQQPPERDPLEALDEQLAMVAYAREHGWNSVFTGHHYLLEEVRKLQPVPFLARLAAETGDMQVGLCVLLLALHNPVEVAETLASLDVVTGGRLVFGAALGYREEEYAAFGVARGERTRRFEANLDVVTRLLEGQAVTVDLPWCRLEGARLVNRPVQRPRPPLWVGANSDRAVARAARMGDTWIINPHARRDTVRDQVALFRTARAGRPVAELPALKEVFCAETREAAWERCLPYLGTKYRRYLAWGQDTAMPDGDSLDRPVAELVDQRFVVGSPDDCLEELARWRDEVGVTHFILRTEWSGMPSALARRSLELLTERVIPRLRAGEGSARLGSPATVAEGGTRATRRRP